MTTLLEFFADKKKKKKCIDSGLNTTKNDLYQLPFEDDFNDGKLYNNEFPTAGIHHIFLKAFKLNTCKAYP